jgi:hypothetical protein
MGPGQAYVPPPFTSHTGGVSAPPRAGAVPSFDVGSQAVIDSIKVDKLIRAFQVCSFFALQNKFHPFLF